MDLNIDIPELLEATKLVARDTRRHLEAAENMQVEHGRRNKRFKERVLFLDYMVQELDMRVTSMESILNLDKQPLKLVDKDDDK